MKQHMGTIGPSVLIRGELSATDDLTIEGQVEGKIALHGNALTIGPSARIEAQVVAKVVNVSGKVEGDITAIEAINILDTATVNGALSAPCVGIEEGASFRGEVDISLSIPLQRVMKQLRPQKPHMRFLKRLVVNSFSAFRHDADPRPLFGVSPKLAAATMRLQVGSGSRRETAR